MAATRGLRFVASGSEFRVHREKWLLWFNYHRKERIKCDALRAGINLCIFELYLYPDLNHFIWHIFFLLNYLNECLFFSPSAECSALQLSEVGLVATGLCRFASPGCNRNFVSVRARVVVCGGCHSSSSFRSWSSAPHSRSHPFSFILVVIRSAHSRVLYFDNGTGELAAIGGSWHVWRLSATPCVLRPLTSCPHHWQSHNYD